MQRATGVCVRESPGATHAVITCTNKTRRMNGPGRKISTRSAPFRPVPSLPQRPTGKRRISIRTSTIVLRSPPTLLAAGTDGGWGLSERRYGLAYQPSRCYGIQESRRKGICPKPRGIQKRTQEYSVQSTKYNKRGSPGSIPPGPAAPRPGEDRKWSCHTRAARARQYNVRKRQHTMSGRRASTGAHGVGNLRRLQSCNSCFCPERRAGQAWRLYYDWHAGCEGEPSRRYEVRICTKKPTHLERPLSICQDSRSVANRGESDTCLIRHVIEKTRCAERFSPFGL